MRGSFAVQFGDYFLSGDHLRACTGLVLCVCMKGYVIVYQVIANKFSVNQRLNVNGTLVVIQI